jgi:hypothetical protein
MSRILFQVLLNLIYILSSWSLNKVFPLQNVKNIVSSSMELNAYSQCAHGTWLFICKISRLLFQVPFNLINILTFVENDVHMDIFILNKGHCFKVELFIRSLL